MFNRRSAICDLRVRRGLVCALSVLLSVSLHTPTVRAQTADPSHQQFLFGYKLLQRGENQLAAEAFDQYLRDFPTGERRGDVMYYRAMLYRKAGRNDVAAKMLAVAPAPRLVPGYAVSLLRGQALSDVGDHAGAIQALDTIDLKPLTPQVAASVWYLKGLAYRGSGDLGGAARSFGAAAEFDSPVRARALIDQARTRAAMGESADAVALLRNALALDDAAAPAEAARLAGDLSAESGRLDDAIEFYHIVTTGYPTSEHFGPSVVGTMRAQFLAGRHDQVIDTLRRFGDVLPVQDKVQATYLAASAHQSRGEHERAAVLFDQISQADARTPLQERTLYKLAVSRFELGLYDKTREAIARLTALFPQTELLPDAAFLLAAVDAKQGQVERGAARLTELINRGPSSPYHAQSLRLRAQLYEQNYLPGPAIADYRAYLAATDQLPGAGALPGAGRGEAALRLADLLTRGDQAGEAAAVADTLLKRGNLPPAIEQEAMYRRAVALGKAGQHEEALRQLDVLATKHPLNPFRDAATYQRGLLLVSLGRIDHATKPLQEASQRESLDMGTRISALRVLSAAQRDAAKEDAAEASLSAMIKLAGDKALLPSERVWLGRYRVEHEQYQAAVDLLRSVPAKADTLPAPLVAEALYHLGRAYRMLGQTDDAMGAIEHVLALGEGFDLDAQLEMARLLSKQDPIAALETYKGLSLCGDSRVEATALFESAQLYRDIAQAHRRADDAEGVAEANNQARLRLKKLVLVYPFEQLYPMPQQAYLLLAEIAKETNDVEARRSELNELAAKYPDSAHAMYAKALLAQDRQRLGEAATLLKSAREKNSDPALGPMIERSLKEVGS